MTADEGKVVEIANSYYNLEGRVIFEGKGMLHTRGSGDGTSNRITTASVWRKEYVMR